MAKRPAVYEFLRETSNLAADDLLAAAMVDAEPPYCGHAAQVLVDRARPAGLAGAVKKFHLLRKEAQEHVVAHAEPSAGLEGHVAQQVVADH